MEPLTIVFHDQFTCEIVHQTKLGMSVYILSTYDQFGMELSNHSAFSEQGARKQAWDQYSKWLISRSKQQKEANK